MSHKKPYSEVWIKLNEIPAFPAECPDCKSPVIRNETREIEYSCGGGYTQKSQIQNHTDKFWGSCGEMYYE